MPKTNGVKNQPKSQWDYKFVSCELSKEEIQTVKAGLSNFEHLDFIHRMVSDGFKLTVSFDERSDCFTAFLTPRDPKNHEFGYLMLSGRAPNVEGALAVLAFKHYEKLKENWLSAKTPTADSWQ